MHKRFPPALVIFFIAPLMIFAEADMPGGALTTFDEIAAQAAKKNDADAGKDLTVKLAVIGPGDELYFWWGHIALVIENAATGKNRFYDYGVFSFENEHFFRNFAMGRLNYMCVVSPAERNYENYIATNRDITLYTLNLAPEKRAEIRRFVEINVRPENRQYLYHHFKKNCVTPILDLLDYALDGRFREKYGDMPGRFTLRQHVRRHTYFDPFMDWILNFWMGQDIDTPTTVWQEMFLPSEVGMRVSEFEYTDGAGVQQKLVSDIEILNKSRGRHPVLDRPRRQWIRELILGVLIAALCFYLLHAENKNKGLKKWPAIALGVTQSALGLFFGVSGSLLFFLTFFTNHDYAWHNVNVIFANPLILAAFPLGLIAAFSKNEKRRKRCCLFLGILWMYCLVFALLSLVLELTKVYPQDSYATYVLLLPVLAVFAVTNIRCWRKR